jgi:hypothetical protein
LHVIDCGEIALDMSVERRHAIGADESTRLLPVQQDSAL